MQRTQSPVEAAAGGELPQRRGEETLGGPPDKAVRALVVPASISLDTTPDMESRVVIRSSAGSTLTSMDHSSPRGS